MQKLISRTKDTFCNGVLGCLFLIVSVVISGAQTSATISNTPAEVDAGDVFTVTVTFDTSSTCQHTVYIPIGSPSYSYSYLQGSLEAGQKTAILRYTFPKDFAGKFTSNDPTYPKPFLSACQGFSRQPTFSAPAITVNVNPVPDANTYPASAQVALSLTQKQFLGTKIGSLKALSTQIDTRVDSDGRDSVQLRKFLVEIVEQAETQLSTTESEYRAQILKSGEAIPEFFADFHKQYVDLRTELRAPDSRVRVSSTSNARFVYVQQTLKQRKLSDVPVRSGNSSGTAPSVAKAVESTLSDNASAYKIVQTTGHAVFHARFESFPTGATLYYRQAILPEFSAWSKTTNISGVDFPLATFVFKFHKDECQDEPVVRVDPYTNIDPDVSVEFKRCKKQ